MTHDQGPGAMAMNETRRVLRGTRTKTTQTTTQAKHGLGTIRRRGFVFSPKEQSGFGLSNITAASKHRTGRCQSILGRLLEPERLPGETEYEAKAESVGTTNDQRREGASTGGLGHATKTSAAPVALALQGTLIGTVLDVFYVAVLVRILSSWFPSIPPLLDPIINLSRQITEPVFQPFRQLIPPLRMGNTMIDISGIIVIFLINFLRHNVAGAM